MIIMQVRNKHIHVRDVKMEMYTDFLLVHSFPHLVHSILHSLWCVTSDKSMKWFVLARLWKPRPPKLSLLRCTFTANHYLCLALCRNGENVHNQQISSTICHLGTFMLLSYVSLQLLEGVAPAINKEGKVTCAVTK